MNPFHDQAQQDNGKNLSTVEVQCGIVPRVRVDKTTKRFIYFVAI